MQNNLRLDIIILIIQPETITLGDKLSQEVQKILKELEDWFYETAKAKG